MKVKDIIQKLNMETMDYNMKFSIHYTDKGDEYDEIDKV